MIGKAFISRSFSRSVRYAVEKPHAHILAADGVRIDSCQSIIKDFKTLCRFKPNLERAVGHVSLSWSPSDKQRLSPRTMVARAKEYMEKMGVRDTQYLIVEHRNTTHPHIHIIFNRVNYFGQAISDWRLWPNTVKTCTEMRQKYGYRMPQDKYPSKSQRLKGVEKVRAELYDTLQQELSQAISWKELQTKLQQKGVTLRFRHDTRTGQVQGVSFKKGKLSFKGSGINRLMSYGNITCQLEQNLQLKQRQTRKHGKRPLSFKRPRVF